MKVRTLGTLGTLAASMMVISALGQQPESTPQQPEPPLHLTPDEIAIYRWAPTLIQWSRRQIEECQVLHKLQPAESQAPLSQILERAGLTGDLAFHDFPQITCDESVTSEVASGDRTISKRQKFLYIVLPRPVGDVRVLEEYRTDLKGAPANKFNLHNLFALTIGFASSWLYLSSAEQPDSHFRYFGTQTLRNRKCHVVGFAQDPDKAQRVSEYRIQGKTAGLLLVQGLVWIDTQTFQALRVMTWLLAPRMDIGLDSQISTVEFYEVRPAGTDRTLWLPRDVNVWTLCRGVGVRNTHHYSNFKLFRVESTIKPAP